MGKVTIELDKSYKLWKAAYRTKSERREGAYLNNAMIRIDDDGTGMIFSSNGYVMCALPVYNIVAEGDVPSEFLVDVLDLKKAQSASSGDGLSVFGIDFDEGILKFGDGMMKTWGLGDVTWPGIVETTLPTRVLPGNLMHRVTGIDVGQLRNAAEAMGISGRGPQAVDIHVAARHPREITTKVGDRFRRWYPVYVITPRIENARDAEWLTPPFCLVVSLGTGKGIDEPIDEPI